MDVKIMSANCEVVSSGLVTSFGGAPINISLPNSRGADFRIKFEFIKDEQNKEHSLRASSDSAGVIFFLTNFAKPLGTGTVKPINFASEESTGKALYINFYVYSVGESNPTLQYTIYREDGGEENARQ